MTRHALFTAAAMMASAAATGASPGYAQSSTGQITVLYDAFGKDAAMRKDWGFSALVEVAGKRILIDTGDDRDIFAANVKAKGVDLNDLDFVVLSHRHSDHMAGLSHVLSVNPKVKIYAPHDGLGGIYGSSIPSSFYRKDGSLPPEMRYYDGRPPDILKLGRAWQDANIELIDKTTEIAPGITLIALVSETPGTRELKELSLAVNTPDGLVLVVGCSHPGIEKIVEAAAAINPKIHLIAGGFHLVVAPDDAIAKMVTALKDTFKVENVAPGHCTGEPTFAALKQAFGNRYIYAGVGSSLPLGPSTGARERRGEGPAFEKDELTAYRKLARREDPFGLLQARSSRSQFLHSEGE
jgi:7,8-dihydropterin-6-yl-methyl-4-(beta-D-ribofuranosyl)aminobenzene 5'-phosphate synthase